MLPRCTPPRIERGDMTPIWLVIPKASKVKNHAQAFLSFFVMAFVSGASATEKVLPRRPCRRRSYSVSLRVAQRGSVAIGIGYTWVTAPFTTAKTKNIQFKLSRFSR